MNTPCGGQITLKGKTQKRIINTNMNSWYIPLSNANLSHHINVSPMESLSIYKESKIMFTLPNCIKHRCIGIWTGVSEPQDLSFHRSNSKYHFNCLCAVNIIVVIFLS